MYVDVELPPIVKVGHTLTGGLFYMSTVAVDNMSGWPLALTLLDFIIGF